MHQFAATILSLIANPFHWIVVLIIAAFVFRGRTSRRGAGIAAVIIFLVFSNPWFLDKYAAWWQPSPVTSMQGRTYSCGIIAGGFASPEKSGDGVFNMAADRFIQGLRLYKTGSISHILISGGNGKKELAAFREAAWVKDQLNQMGVPDSVILIEDRSNNTADNAVNSKGLLSSRQLQPPYLLISSAYHLPRAQLIFKKAGLVTDAYPCNYLAGRGITTVSSFIPSLDALATWPFFLKETAAYLYYR